MFSKRDQKKSYNPKLLFGVTEIMDKLGSIKVKFPPKNIFWPWFNIIETEQLGKVIENLIEPTPETSILDLGCAIGAISNMLATVIFKFIYVLINNKFTFTVAIL